MSARQESTRTDYTKQVDYSRPASDTSYMTTTRSPLADATEIVSAIRSGHARQITVGTVTDEQVKDAQRLDIEVILNSLGWTLDEYLAATATNL